MIELEPGAEGNGLPRLRRIIDPYERHEAFRAVAHDSRIVDRVESLLGPDLDLQHSKLNMKPARVGSPVHWHQDLAYYPHTNEGVMAVLVYIDAAAEANGCLQVLPGRHPPLLRPPPPRRRLRRADHRVHRARARTPDPARPGRQRHLPPRPHPALLAAQPLRRRPAHPDIRLPGRRRLPALLRPGDGRGRGRPPPGEGRPGPPRPLRRTGAHRPRDRRHQLPVRDPGRPPRRPPPTPPLRPPRRRRKRRT